MLDKVVPETSRIQIRLTKKVSLALDFIIYIPT